MNVFAVGTEINNRITNYLAQTVISHFSAAIRFKQCDVSLVQLCFVQKNGRVVPAPSDSERVRMFQQKQRVELSARFYSRFDLFLDREGRLVIHESYSLAHKLSFSHLCNQAVDLCVILTAALVLGTISPKTGGVLIYLSAYLSGPPRVCGYMSLRFP